MSNTIPKVLIETGLPTNPVHVLDLSVILPGIFISGLLVLRKKPLGYILTPVMLVFFILMNITIGVLVIMMQQQRLGGNLSITFVMVFFALASIILLYLFLKK